MSFPRKLSLGVALAAIHLVACNKGDSGNAPAATTTAAKPATTTAAPKPATTTAPAATAKPAAAAKLPDIMTPDEAMDHFKADKSSMMAKKVKIKGYYFNYTKQGDQLNVEVTGKPDVSSHGPLCIFPGSAKAALDKVKQKSQITVAGTVDGEFFGRPKLKDCTLE